MAGECQVCDSASDERMRTKPGQLVFDFVVEMDFAAEELKKQEVLDSHERNNDSHWKWVKREHPVTEAEKIWLPQGIRLARHVHHRECEECESGPEDHSEGNKWEQAVCLKDVRQIESELGVKLESCYQTIRLAPADRQMKKLLAKFPDYQHLITIVELVSLTGIAESALRPLLGLMHIKGLVWQVGPDQFHRVRPAGDEEK